MKIWEKNNFYNGKSLENINYYRLLNRYKPLKHMLHLHLCHVHFICSVLLENFLLFKCRYLKIETNDVLDENGLYSSWVIVYGALLIVAVLCYHQLNGLDNLTCNKRDVEVQGKIKCCMFSGTVGGLLI